MSKDPKPRVATMYGKSADKIKRTVDREKFAKLQERLKKLAEEQVESQQLSLFGDDPC